MKFLSTINWRVVFSIFVVIALVIVLYKLSVFDGIINVLQDVLNGGGAEPAEAVEASINILN